MSTATTKNHDLIEDIAAFLPRMLRRAMRKRRFPRDLYDDLLQDCWEKVLRLDLPRFDPTRGPIEPFIAKRIDWFLADVGRAYFAQLRRDDANPAVNWARFLHAEPLDPDAIMERVAHERCASAIGVVAKRALRYAPRQERRVVLGELEGKGRRELAEKLDLHASNVSRARSRAIERLRRVVNAA